MTALDQQIGLAAGTFGVLLYLNNCTDGTEDVVAATAATLSLRLRVIRCENAAATAGWARRRAMEAAAAWLEETAGVDKALLTTDADSRVPADWVARNLAALDAGADAVAGRLDLDPGDAAALPEAIHRRGALEARYEALLTEITARIAPAPGDPWPCHRCCSGASLAASLHAYRAVGGMPDVPLGEDRAFVETMLADDRVVRHDPDIVVVTSGRLLGRAVGGVADTIRRRCLEPDSPCDDRLERLEIAIARALMFRRLRRLHAHDRRNAILRWARMASIERGAAERIAHLRSFGAIRSAFEAATPYLAARPLRPSQLPTHIRRATILVTMLRAMGSSGKKPRLTAGPVIATDGIAVEA